MKKLVLVMVSVLLLALFIAFNYLLWDRESKLNELKNLEFTNSSNNASINAQNREIKRLEDENNSFQETIGELQKDKESLQQRITQLESEKLQTSQETKHKIDVINYLKQNAAPEVFEAPVKKWVEAVGAGNYSEAYQLEYGNTASEDIPVSREEYESSLKDTVKSIGIKAIKLDAEEGRGDGGIILSVTLEVKNAENAGQTARFAEGPNEMKFKLDYNLPKNEFYIAEISAAK